MSDARMAKYGHVQWWPAPIYAAVMFLVGQTSYQEVDPTAPPECAGMVRVRITQAELSETLNASPATIRRVFADMAKMGIMKRAESSRTWYLNKRTDDAPAFTKRMLEQWPLIRETPEPEAEPREIEWYEALDDEDASGGNDSPATVASHPLDPVLRPGTAPPMPIRLTTAINNACTDFAFDPPKVHEWWQRRFDTIEDLADWLRHSNYSTIREWIADSQDDIRAYTSQEPSLR